VENNLVEDNKGNTDNITKTENKDNINNTDNLVEANIVEVNIVEVNIVEDNMAVCSMTEDNMTLEIMAVDNTENIMQENKLGKNMSANLVAHQNMPQTSLEDNMVLNMANGTLGKIENITKEIMEMVEIGTHGKMGVGECKGLDLHGKIPDGECRIMGSEDLVACSMIS
jgi:hypothetical protein